MKAGKIFCTILSLAAVTGGIIYAAFVFSGYARGQKEYASIEKEYTFLLMETDENEEEKEISDSKENETPVRPKEGTKMDDKSIWKVLVAKLPSDAPGRLTINWEGLLKKNSDVIGWISIPAARISYPVVQSDDNEYYLHRGIDGKYLYAGCIFMDADNSPSLMGYNTIIYGHNMRDGSMFAALKDFQSKETLDNCRYFWIQTPASDNLYEICSIHNASPGADTYMLRFADHRSYTEWLEKMCAMSNPAAGCQASSGDRIVTLSTCTADSESRMVIQGKLIYRKDRYN